MILDEPTSSVDLTTEESILTATERLMQNRTTFMIAHHLNMLRSCDTILVLDQGELVEVRSTRYEAVQADPQPEAVAPPIHSDVPAFNSSGSIR